VTGPNSPGDPAAGPKNYENFDLLIKKTKRRRGDRERYEVLLIKAPTGETPPKSHLSFSDKDLKVLLGAGEVWRDLGQKSPAALKSPEEIGSELFRAVISEEIRSRWDTSLAQTRSKGLGLRLRLRLGQVPGLEDWPWELLYDRSHGQFLALSKDISIVRYLENPTRSNPEQIKTPLKVLVVIANPTDCHRLDGEQEWALLNEALGKLKGKVLIERLQPPTLPALETAMKQSWHVVHFVGHGRFVEQEGRLLLEDGSGRGQEVPGRKLRVLLEGQKDLRLVVLNACSGGKTSQENAFAGVAQSLVRLGLPAVVAMRRVVSDRAALAFAGRFYKALAEEIPIDAALSEARRGMHAGSDDLEWSTPVLYMRSEGVVIGPTTRLPWRALLAATLGVTALSGGYWLSTLPDRSTDPACPSPHGLEMPFVKIKPGRFSMGPKGTPVQITRPFCVGRFEVTQKEWKTIMGFLPGQAKEGNDLPVGNISWNEAQAFLVRLNSREPAAHYRLPTDAQWEYAVRAGTSGRFSFGEDPSELRHYGNCSGAKYPTAGGSFQKNPWGLYDTYGNVSEWVADWYGPLTEEPAVDPQGLRTGQEKTRRGGSFDYTSYCNSTYRTGTPPDRKNKEFGLRVVRDPVSKATTGAR
jgi:formylglycine-generating enzyme required for sulfatase activity